MIGSHRVIRRERPALIGSGDPAQGQSRQFGQRRDIAGLRRALQPVPRLRCAARHALPAQIALAQPCHRFGKTGLSGGGDMADRGHPVASLTQPPRDGHVCLGLTKGREDTRTKRGHHMLIQGVQDPDPAMKTLTKG